jgi:multidrug efflux pump subunit AcrA (membrane-fusion protein)
MTAALFLTLLAAMVLAGCMGTAGLGEPAPTEEVPLVTQDEDKVIAEAVIEPARWSELRFSAGGDVAEVMVEEGDGVAKGDLLVRFDATDAALRVREAELALALAEAQLAQTKAGPRPEEMVVAETALEVARSAVTQTLAQRDELLVGATDVDIAAARAQVAVAQVEQVRAEIQHDQTMECFNVKLPDGSKRRICPALGRYEEQARAALHAATDGLTAAETALQATEGEAWARLRDAEAAVESAVARQEIAQARLDLVSGGSRREDVAAAEARVTEAEASLTAARAALDDLEIRAPFDGIIARVSVDAGDTAAPGMAVVIVATLDDLQVRTTDLTELDVARVAQGQRAVVTVDALPDSQLAGVVVRIGEQALSAQGDVTYPVTIDLDRDAPELRWGMTAMVEIEVEGDSANEGTARVGRG